VELKRLFKRYKTFEEVDLFTKIVIVLYCVRVLASAWLAFDIAGHKIFQFIISWTSKLALLVAIVYIFKVQKRITYKSLGLCILPTIYIILILLRDTNFAYFSYSIISILAVYLFLLLSDQLKRKIVELFYELVLVSIVLSTFAYFYALLGLPVKTVSYYTIAYKTHFYYQFGPLAILNSGGLLRMCGPFNEGGNLGTICAFLYAIFDEKNTKIEKAILIVGILLSFSLAGWLLLLIYWLGDLISKKQLKSIIIITALIATILILPTIDFGNEYVNSFVQRFAITSDGLSGDNRTWEGFDQQYDSIVNSDRKWWGAGLDYKVADGSSYKSYIITYGYIGTLMLAMPWLFMCIKYGRKTKHGIIYIVVFFISLYQRPAPITSLFGYAMMFGGLDVMSYDYKLLDKVNIGEYDDKSNAVNTWI
jgi:hypothetical protein